MTSTGVSLTNDMTLTGNSALTTITAKTSGDRRHFYVVSGRTLTLKWLKLTGGSTSSVGGSIYVKDAGSTLHATSCVFFLNTAGSGGGGVYNYEGSTLIQDSIIADNTAVYNGGGISQRFGTATIIRSLISRNRQTSTTANIGGGGVYMEYNAVLNVRETTIEHNRAATNHGHQIMAWKQNYYDGAPAVTVVNTRFIPCTACETTGTNFYLYDDDTSSNSGAAAYGTLSRKTCSASPCTVSPFTGACANRTDDANHGVTCAYSTCRARSYRVGVSESALPPDAFQTCANWTTCAPGKFVTANGTNMADRECSICADERYSPTKNAESCTNWTTCARGEFVTANGTNMADRECSICANERYSTTQNAESCTNWTTCAPGKFVTANGTNMADRECSICADERYSTTKNAESCTNWTTCAPGEFVAENGTNMADRECSICADERYSTTKNAESCTNWTTCVPGHRRYLGQRQGALRVVAAYDRTFAQQLYPLLVPSRLFGSAKSRIQRPIPGRFP
eukprot:Stramenopile-MAST_4_protein_5123